MTGKKTCAKKTWFHCVQTKKICEQNVIDS